MTINFLDFVAYVFLWVISWIVTPEKYKEELAILGFYLYWIIMTILWILIFVFPFDLNISDFFNINWDIKFQP